MIEVRGMDVRGNETVEYIYDTNTSYRMDVFDLSEASPPSISSNSGIVTDVKSGVEYENETLTIKVGELEAQLSKAKRTIELLSVNI